MRRRILVGKRGRPHIEVRMIRREEAPPVDSPDGAPTIVETRRPVIEGYASVFYDGTPETQYQLWDGAVERIMPGAFSRAIVEDDVAALFNHDPDNLLGRSSGDHPTLRLSEDEVGLRYEIDPPDTQIGRDTVTSVKRGDLKGSSFCFEISSEEWHKEEIEGVTIHVREIEEVGLFDVGPVTFPAYGATTAGVRSTEPDILEARASFERWQKRSLDGGTAGSDPAPSRDQVQARVRLVEMQEAG